MDSKGEKTVFKADSDAEDDDSDDEEGGAGQSLLKVYRLPIN